MEVTLTPELQEYVAAQVANGAYPTPDEVIQAGLAVHRQQKLEELRRDLEVAIREADQGLTMPLTDELLAEIKAEVQCELEAERLRD